MLAAVLLVLAPTACGRAPAEPPRRVVFIVLDAVRADRLSILGYERGTTPELDALAQDGVLFRNHFALASQTRASLPQLLFSRYFTPSLFPDSDSVPLEEPWNLFRRLDREAISMPRALAQAGYRTAALSAHAWLRPDSAFAAEFDELRRLGDELPVNRDFGYPTADQVTDAAIAWLDRHRQDDLFLYLHYMDTHFPHPWGTDAQAFAGADLDVGTARRAFTPGGRLRDKDRPLTDVERRYVDALYDGQLRHADREVGRLVHFLRRHGWIDEMLLVVTSDHGEHLGEVPGRFEHGGPWLEAVAHVPWILHYPQRLRPGIYDGLTSAIDVHPTMLALLELPLPAGKRADGRDLSPALRGESEISGVVFAPTGVRTGGHRLLLPHEDGSRLEALLAQAVTPDPRSVSGQLYDISADPLERHNIWEWQPDIAAALLTSWHTSLREPFLRHARSRRDGPPEGPFAIAVRHATLEPPEAVVDAFDEPLRPPHDAAWHWNRTWNNYWLGASPGAEILRLAFAVPSARYDVRAAVSGTCRLTVAGGAPIDLSAPSAGADAESRPVGQRTRVRQYGRVEVRQNRFEATLEVATPEEPCVLRHLGFTPLGNEDEPLAEPSPGHDDRLRALGYVD